MTCFNRKEKTLSCLTSLFFAIDTSELEIDASIYLTDDGCKDCTADAIRMTFPGKDITILQGDGTLYWAGGMRFAWKEALKKHGEWDFYLLLNDDVLLMPNVFEELFEAHRYALEHYGRSGVYSGIMCDTEDHSKMTYGGDIRTNGIITVKTTRLYPKGKPQACNVTNANVLLISRPVVDSIGILYKGYIHARADYDYAWMAGKHNFPVLLTSHFCGECTYDHWNTDYLKGKILLMNLHERRMYFRNPLHSNLDQIIFEWRTNPIRVPILILGRFLNIYFPTVYYYLKKVTG